MKVCEEIALVLENNIKSGFYSLHQKFPSQRQLFAKIFTSKSTITKAFKILESKNFIYSIP